MEFGDKNRKWRENHIGEGSGTQWGEKIGETKMREFGKMLGEYQMGEREGEREKLRKRNKRLMQKK